MVKLQAGLAALPNVYGVLIERMSLIVKSSSLYAAKS